MKILKSKKNRNYDFIDLFNKQFQFIPRWRNFVTEQNHPNIYILYFCIYLTVCVKT